MDLIKLVIFNTSLFLFSYSMLANIILSYLLMSIIYNMKVSYSDNIDTMHIIINLINIIMHMIIYKIYNVIDRMKQTYIGNFIILSYNYLDSKIIYYKNQLFLFPIRCILNKIFGTSLDVKNINDCDKKKVVITHNIKLETNTDISNFLNKILG